MSTARGPARTVTSVAEAARIARSGDTILIDAGDYVGTWPRGRRIS